MTYKRLPLAIVLIFALACNYVTRSIPTVLVPPSTIGGATRSATSPLPVTGAISTLQPAWIPPDCAGTPIATVIPATEEALPTPVSQANKPIDQQTQLQIFDQTVQTVNNVYVYPDFNANDWG